MTVSAAPSATSDGASLVSRAQRSVERSEDQPAAAMLRRFRGPPPAELTEVRSTSSQAEQRRLDALSNYDILDTEAEPQFDLIVRLASELTGCPVAVINLIAENRVWTKAALGMARGEMERGQAYCSMVIESSRGLDIPDLRADPRTNQLPLTVEQGFIMYSGVPLCASCGQPIGTLAVLDSIPRRLTERQLDWLQQLGQQAMALLELRRKQRELQQAQTELQRLVHIDPLTGLMNLRAWREANVLEQERHSRWGGGHSVIALDLDHFKSVNDRYGHAAGDAVLQAVGGLLGQTFRRLDTVARIGGEEFGVLLPHTKAADALKLAEQLRSAVEQLRIPYGDTEITITASIGVAHSSEPNSRGRNALVLADERSYVAKRAGRNRVVSAGDGAETLTT